MKSFALVLLVAAFANAAPDLHDYIEKRVESILEDVFDGLNEKHDVAATTPEPYQQCTLAGVKCTSCSHCYPGGWCLKHPKTGQVSKQCICNYGWTGLNGRYKGNTDDKRWGINRIVALDCDTPCHYTHHVRNKTCEHKGSHPPITPKPVCDKNVCEANGRGRCVDGVCECCRGWTGIEAKYGNDNYVTDGVKNNCDRVCPYLGKGIENPNCKDPPNPIPPCDPLCESQGGRCNATTGRCHCCEGWTGVGGRFEEDGGISADGRCDVYCQYTKQNKNLLCVNPSYIRRSTIRL